MLMPRGANKLNVLSEHLSKPNASYKNTESTYQESYKKNEFAFETF